MASYYYSKEKSVLDRMKGDSEEKGERAAGREKKNPSGRPFYFLSDLDWVPGCLPGGCLAAFAGTT